MARERQVEPGLRFGKTSMMKQENAIGIGGAGRKGSHRDTPGNYGKGLGK